MLKTDLCTILFAYEMDNCLVLFSESSELGFNFLLHFVDFIVGSFMIKFHHESDLSALAEVGDWRPAYHPNNS